MTGDSSGTSTSGDCESFSWAVRLSDKAPNKRYVVLAVALLAGAVGILIFRSPLFGFLGFAIIVLSTAEFWLGTRFKIGSNGISSKTGLSLTSIEWVDVKRILVEGETVRFSPLPAPSRADVFRGVVVHMSDQSHAPVYEAIEKYANDDVQLLGYRTDTRGDGDPS